MAKRKGNPPVGLTMSPDEIALVDAYKDARGLSSRSRALYELVCWALGDNEAGVSAIDEKLMSSDRKRLKAKASKTLRIKFSS